MKMAMNKLVRMPQNHVDVVPLMQQLLPPLSDSLRKGENGRIAVVGGSDVYTGAPYFSAITALKIGADMVHVFCPASAAPIIKSYSPELMVHPSYDYETLKESVHRIDAFILGPGLGRHKSAQMVVRDVVELSRQNDIPLIIDADGLHMLANDLESIRGYSKAVLTPNYFEFTRLYSMAFNVNEVNEKKRNSGEAAEELAQHLNVTIFQKGKIDMIAAGSGLILGKTDGSPRRCGGQGDLLNGALATLTLWAHRRNISNPVGVAAEATSQLIRMAARFGFEKHGRSLLSSDIINEIPDIIKRFDKMQK